MGAGVKIKSMAPVVEWIVTARRVTVTRQRASVVERAMMGRRVRRDGTDQTVRSSVRMGNGDRIAVLTVAIVLIRRFHLTYCLSLIL